MKNILFFIALFCSPFLMPAQWIPVTVPTHQGLVGITFSDTLHGYIQVWDGSVLESSDGGKTWQSANTPAGANMVDICFPTTSTGYSVGNEGVIIKTINAGTTWSVINSPTPFVLRGVFFLNANTGFICGQDENIFSTTDGGTNWTVQTSGSYWLRQFSFPTLQTGYCAGDGMTIYKTTNGGLTWILLVQTGGTNLNSIKFVTVDTGYVCGLGGYIAKSVDGGQTWQALNTGTTKDLNGLWFINSHTGYCVGSSGLILKTNDGGTSWTQDSSGFTGRLMKLYFINKNKGFICGDSGTLLKTCVQSPGSITGPPSVCLGDTGKIYSVNPVAGATGYHWSVPSGVIITSANNTNIITVKFPSNSVSGTFSVYAYNAGCNSAFSPAFSVTVNPVPATPFVTNDGHLLFSTAPLGNQWYYNGAPISGATGQIYDANLSGTGYFWTVVTLAGCSSDTSNHKFFSNGIDPHPSFTINVYPTPNNGIFNISITSSTNETFTLSVYNCLGVKIYEETNVEVDHSLQKVVDLRPLPNGVYTLILKNTKSQITRKIVVNN